MILFPILSAIRVFPTIRLAWIWTAGLGLLAAVSAWAQPSKLGDLDGDGKATIHDVAAILNHVHGRVPLPKSLVYFADVDGNGIVNVADADLAAAAAVEGTPLTDVATRPVLSSFRPYTNRNIFSFEGNALPRVRVLVRHALGAIETQTDERGVFDIQAPLAANQFRQFYVSSFDAFGNPTPPLPFRVLQDSQGPAVEVRSPPQGEETFLSEITIAGTVSDALSGQHGLSVTVNGANAAVFLGDGSNGSFLSAPISLQEGENRILVLATDVVGNETAVELVVNRRRPEGFRLLKEFGDLQEGLSGGQLSKPASVLILDPNGRPIVGKPVVFQVLGGLGKISLARDAASPGNLRLSVLTDSDGRAQVYWRLGILAGKGNHLLKAESRDVQGRTYFAASALPSDDVRLSYISGDGQIAATGTAAAEPLRVWVNDGANALSQREVTFAVLTGGGKVGGRTSFSTTSNNAGFAEAQFVLGNEAGAQTVSASVPGRVAPNVLFALQAVNPNPDEETTVGGLVLTPFWQPVADAKVEIIIEGRPFESANTDAAGSFRLTGLSPGAAVLRFWLPAEETSNQPSLRPAVATKELFLIRGIENQLRDPVVLPFTKNRAAIPFDGASDVELTLPGIEGFRLTIAAGSLADADGNIPTAESPLLLSLTQIPAHGQSFLAWLLEPANAQFLSPPQIRIPDLADWAGDFSMGVFDSNNRIRPFRRTATARAEEKSPHFSTKQGKTQFRAGFGFAAPSLQNGRGTIAITREPPPLPRR